ncbi:hypothetical protein GALL_418770 [mine drainage metagenome]|uniref:Uncharacterized protein n=1 Tax=mine drainage metagenome TaxID=410659 RepID=A0A1J5PY83_9ZZZZ
MRPLLGKLGREPVVDRDGRGEHRDGLAVVQRETGAQRELGDEARGRVVDLELLGEASQLADAEPAGAEHRGRGALPRPDQHGDEADDLLGGAGGLGVHDVGVTRWAVGSRRLDERDRVRASATQGEADVPGQHDGVRVLGDEEPALDEPGSGACRRACAVGRGVTHGWAPGQRGQDLARASRSRGQQVGEPAAALRHARRHDRSEAAGERAQGVGEPGRGSQLGGAGPRVPEQGEVGRVVEHGRDVRVGRVESVGEGVGGHRSAEVVHDDGGLEHLHGERVEARDRALDADAAGRSGRERGERRRRGVGQVRSAQHQGDERLVRAVTQVLAESGHPCNDTASRTAARPRVARPPENRAASRRRAR